MADGIVASKNVGRVRRERNDCVATATSPLNKTAFFNKRAHSHRSCGPARKHVRTGQVILSKAGTPLAQVRWPSSNAPIYANLFDDEYGDSLSLMLGGRENWLRCILDRPDRLRWAELAEDSQAHPGRSADEDRADASEDLTPGERGYSGLRHDENDAVASPAAGKANAASIPARKIRCAALLRRKFISRKMLIVRPIDEW